MYCIIMNTSAMTKYLQAGADGGSSGSNGGETRDQTGMRLPEPQMSSQLKRDDQQNFLYVGVHAGVQYMLTRDS
jgi:hypothetical protein